MNEQKAIRLFGHIHDFKKMSEDNFTLPSEQQLAEVRKFIRNVKQGDRVGIESPAERMNMRIIEEYSKNLTDEFLTNPSIKAIWKTQRAMQNRSIWVGQDELLAAIALRKGAQIIPVDSNKAVHEIESLGAARNLLASMDLTSEQKYQLQRLERIGKFLRSFPKLKERFTRLTTNWELTKEEKAKLLEKIKREITAVRRQVVIPVRDRFIAKKMIAEKCRHAIGGYAHIPGIAVQLRQLGITPIIVHAHPRKREGQNSRAWKAYLKRKAENKRRLVERKRMQLEAGRIRRK